MGISTTRTALAKNNKKTLIRNRTIVNIPKTSLIQRKDQLESRNERRELEHWSPVQVLKEGR